MLITIYKHTFNFAFSYYYSKPKPICQLFSAILRVILHYYNISAKIDDKLSIFWYNISNLVRLCQNVAMPVVPAQAETLTVKMGNTTLETGYYIPAQGENAATTVITHMRQAAPF